MAKRSRPVDSSSSGEDEAPIRLPPRSDTLEAALARVVAAGDADAVRAALVVPGLRPGAVVDLRAPRHRSLLQVAASAGHAAVTRQLLAWGETWDYPRDAGGSAAVSYAVGAANVECLRLVLDSAAARTSALEPCDDPVVCGPNGGPLRVALDNVCKFYVDGDRGRAAAGAEACAELLLERLASPRAAAGVGCRAPSRHR